MGLKNKLLVYKSIIKPIWTYGIQLWGTAANSKIDIIERFQSKTLRQISNAPNCISNNIILQDFNLKSVHQEIKIYCNNYAARLASHPNNRANTLMETRKA